MRKNEEKRTVHGLGTCIMVVEDASWMVLAVMISESTGLNEIYMNIHHGNEFEYI
jgi:hypothetical protein